MDAAFIFGTTGNVSSALGSGWSVEDGFAWAIGTESQLTLPLPGDANTHVLRFDAHPAIFPPKVQRQRLMIRAGKIVLGSFEMTERTNLVMTLPLELTSGATRLELTFIHPDATRPRDHMPVDDGRRLAVCFHSASVTQPGNASGPTAAGPGQAPLETVHGIIAGHATAMRIARVISKLPCLKGRFGIRFVDLAEPLEDAEERLRPESIATAQFCWLQLNSGVQAARDALRGALPEACVTRTFFSPVMNALWPFEGPDPRAVFEPGRYNPSRYPYGDRLAQILPMMSLPDDVIYLMYDMAAQGDPVDLDQINASDLRRWRAEGKKSDMQLALFIDTNLSTKRLFAASHMPGALLLREMVDQVLDDGLLRDLADPGTIAAELDALFEGYVGQHEEIPVHRRVAEHFKLEWWSPDLKYRWINNVRTDREYIIDYIRWTQWRP